MKTNKVTKLTIKRTEVTFVTKGGARTTAPAICPLCQRPAAGLDDKTCITAERGDADGKPAAHQHPNFPTPVGGTEEN